MDINIFVESLLKNPPKEKKSVQLTLDLEEDNEENIFNFLLETFTLFMKNYYGNNINLDNIDEKYIKIIQQYFNSFGFKIEYIIYKNIDEIKCKNIPKNKLAMLYMDIKCDINCYRIMFDYI